MRDFDIEKYVASLSHEEIYRVLTLAPAKIFISWQKLLETGPNPLLLGDIKGTLIEAFDQFPAQILNDNDLLYQFILHFTKRLSTRK